jgi:hypothetical protein
MKTLLITRKLKVRESRMTFVLLQLTMNTNLSQLLVRIWAVPDIKFLIQGHLQESKRIWKETLKRNDINVNNVG